MEAQQACYSKFSLAPKLRKGFEIKYIGSYNGIEKEIITDAAIEYYPISSGKLRRYFDVKNFTDPFKSYERYLPGIKYII